MSLLRDGMITGVVDKLTGAEYANVIAGAEEMVEIHETRSQPVESAVKLHDETLAAESAELFKLTETLLTTGLVYTGREEIRKVTS
jgi:uncharacterized protein YbcI